MVRLFIYNREAFDKPDAERRILQQQFTIMIRRLWFGITWPSCILTLVFGTWLIILYNAFPMWLLIKLGFVVGLLIYHASLHFIYRKQSNGNFDFSSTQLRIWNEVATLFLVAIVMLVVVKNEISIVWGGLGILLFGVMVFGAIRIYRLLRR